jgi:hypothetical protein
VVCRWLAVDELVRVRLAGVSELVKEVEIPEAFVSGHIHLSGMLSEQENGNLHLLHEDVCGQLQLLEVRWQHPRIGLGTFFIFLGASKRSIS